MINLWLGISTLLMLAIVFIVYSVRSKIKAIVLIVLIGVASLSLYHYLGNSQGLKNAILLQAFNEEENVLPELIQGLQQQLNQHPDDPTTLILLGKIYFSAQDYQDASDAFAKAYVLTPDDHDLLIEYTTAAFLANNGVLNPQLNDLLVKIKKLPASIESLSLLANVAISTGDKSLAIQYWQQMQTMVPKDSPLYQELSATIEFVNSR